MDLSMGSPHARIRERFNISVKSVNAWLANHICIVLRLCACLSGRRPYNVQDIAGLPLGVSACLVDSTIE